MTTLKNFIKETLSEITDALTEFAEEKGGTGASPHPDGLHIPQGELNQKFMYSHPTEEGVAYKDVVAVEASKRRRESKTQTRKTKKGAFSWC